MDKPRAKRRDCLARIKVSWQAAGVARSEWGMLQDKSKTGFGFRLPVAMTSGSLAAIQLGFTTHFGVVRHCTKTNGQYFIGFELCEVDENVKLSQANRNLSGLPARESEKEESAPEPEMPKPEMPKPELPKNVSPPVPLPSKLSRDDFEMAQTK